MEDIDDLGVSASPGLNYTRLIFSHPLLLKSVGLTYSDYGDNDILELGRYQL